MAKTKKTNNNKYISKRINISSDVKVSMSAKVRENLCKYYIEKVVISAKRKAFKDEIKTLNNDLKTIENQIRLIESLKSDKSAGLLSDLSDKKHSVINSIEFIEYKMTFLSECHLDNTVVVDNTYNQQLYASYCEMCNGNESMIISNTATVLKQWGISLSDKKIDEFVCMVNGINSKVVLNTARLTKALPYKKYLTRFYDTMIDFLVSFNDEIIEKTTNSIKAVIESKVDSITVEQWLKSLDE